MLVITIPAQSRAFEANFGSTSLLPSVELAVVHFFIHGQSRGLRLHSMLRASTPHECTDLQATHEVPGGQCSNDLVNQKESI